MLNHAGEELRFGPFELRSSTGELFKDGLNLKLPPQPLRVLLLLVSRPGELIAREELQDALWSDGTTVEFDQSLNFCIRQIRAALADDAREPKYIETFPKRGYRFIAPVTRIAQRDDARSVIEPEPQPEPAALLSSPSSHPMVWLALAVIAVVAIVIFALNRAEKPNSIPSAILVRPFVNLELPAEDAWFSDALTQQVIGALAETKAIRVVPWSSSLALKGQSAGVPELGKRFQVDGILEGSIGRRGPRLRVVTQLVDVATQRTLWSYQDDREAPDLGSVQDDIMSAIASTLKLRLAEPTTPMVRRRPQDLETYNLYLKAVFLGDQLHGSSGDESVKDLEEVIRRVPDFAPAYATLASELAVLPFFHPMQAKEMLSRSREAAEKAIALDPGLAFAHVALAHSLFNRWKWKESESEFQTALSLDPESAAARHLYGLFLSSQGRHDDAVREARRAADLAPTSALVSFSASRILLQAGNFDEAIMQGQRTIQLDRGFYQAYEMIARSYLAKGMAAEAIQALNEWDHFQPFDVQPLWRALQLAKSDHKQQALAITNQWLASNPRASRAPMGLVVALVAAGEKDHALAAIRRSVEQHVPSMVWLRSTPELAEIRSDPRFAAAVSLMDSD